MSDIQRLMALLKSDNPNDRYNACEEMRVSRQPLPQEAIDALNSATNDSNPDVTDAAQRALAIHAPQVELAIVDNNTAFQSQKESIIPMTYWRATKFGITIGLVPAALIFVYGSLSLNIFYGLVFILVSLAPLVMPGGIVGGLIGFQWNKTRSAALIGAILKTIFVSIIIFFYLLNYGSPFGVPQ